MPITSAPAVYVDGIDIRVRCYSLGPVLFSDWPAHFRHPLLDPKGPRNAKKPDMFMRKNGAPPDFVLNSENH